MSCMDMISAYIVRFSDELVKLTQFGGEEGSVAQGLVKIVAESEGLGEWDYLKKIDEEFQELPLWGVLQTEAGLSPPGGGESEIGKRVAEAYREEYDIEFIVGHFNNFQIIAGYTRSGYVIVLDEYTRPGEIICERMSVDDWVSQSLKYMFSESGIEWLEIFFEERDDTKNQDSSPSRNENLSEDQVLRYYQYICRGQYKEADELALSAGITVNDLLPSGFTVFSSLCRSSVKEAISWAIEQGADLDKVTSGDPRTHPQIVITSRGMRQWYDEEVRRIRNT